jgi:alpha-ketoglutarate-dependent taurine dioxygenase
MSAALNNCDENSPYLLDNESEYQAWRARKLKYRQEVSATRVFELDQQGRLSPSMLSSLHKQVAAYNFVIFQSAVELDKADFLALNRQFGLVELDANLGADADRVTSLQVVGDADERAQYIPYTNRAMNWHTDGYYNACERRIDAFALYCVNQAERGGGNYLFDHEMMYMLIRDQSPTALAALMRNDMLRVPANVQQNRVIRAEESGPVFSLQAQCRALNMRYTSRPQNIVWKADKRSTDALNLVREILMEGSATVEVRLQPRQGIVCNNLLHGRQAFHDAADHPARLIYRARYHDAIDLDKGFGAELLD